MDFENDIIQCLSVLKAGGTILYPTDTVWGIGCDATNSAAVEKIFRVKQRPSEKSLIVLVAGERDILQYTASTDLALFDYLQANPRPTTVIYDGAIGLAENVVAHNGTVAIRICHDNFCRQLLKRFRKPIVSTSANISGNAAPRIYLEIEDIIKNNVDYVVQHRQQDTEIAAPSAIIKWDNGKVTIIRP